MDHQLCSPNSSQFYTIYFDQVGPLDFDYHAVFHGQKDLADEMEMTKLASNYFSDIGVTMPIHFDSSFIRWFFEVHTGAKTSFLSRNSLDFGSSKCEFCEK